MSFACFGQVSCINKKRLKLAPQTRNKNMLKYHYGKKRLVGFRRGIKGQKIVLSCKIFYPCTSAMFNLTIKCRRGGKRNFVSSSIL